MDQQTLTRLAASPHTFRQALIVDTDRGPRKLVSVLDDWQRRDFEALDDGWRLVVGHDLPSAKSRGYFERPRGHSKTFDLAAMVTWCLIASRRKLSGIAAAGDKGQARLLCDAIARLITLNHWLTDVLEVHRDRIVNRHTKSELLIISSDAPTSYGLTPHFIIVDELSHWPSRDLWDSLISSAAKRARCMMVVISNAGYGESWNWHTREAIRQDPAWYFSRLDGPRASWISAERLAEQRRHLPAIIYERLWNNQWTEGAGDAFDYDDITAALNMPAQLDGPERGWSYALGLDVGIKHDYTALVILGKYVGYSETIELEPDAAAKPVPLALAVARRQGFYFDDDPPPDPPAARYHTTHHRGDDRLRDRLRVAKVCVFRPQDGRFGQVEFDQVEAAILREARRFDVDLLAADPSQALQLLERLRAKDLQTREVPFTGPNLNAMASDLLAHFREHRIDLFDHAQLLADLRAMRIVEKSYGFRLESPRNRGEGHGDAGTALAIAIVGARELSSAATTEIEGELVCWP